MSGEAAGLHGSGFVHGSGPAAIDPEWGGGSEGVAAAGGLAVAPIAGAGVGLTEGADGVAGVAGIAGAAAAAGVEPFCSETTSFLSIVRVCPASSFTQYLSAFA